MKNDDNSVKNIKNEDKIKNKDSTKRRATS